MNPETHQSTLRSGLLRAPPIPPPKGFVALTVDDNALKSHGLPRRPAMEIFPQRYAQWERLMSKQLSFVAPEYVVVKKDATDLPITARVHDGIPTARGESETWSGAVNTMVRCGDRFQHIEASWTVPGVFPTPDKWENAGTWDNDPSQYACGIWVGIDGYHISHDVLQAGTGMKCSVNEDGSLGGEIFAWFEWFPDDVIELTKFRVHAGDIITVLLDFTGPSSADDDDDTVTGQVVFINESNATYTSFEYEYTAPDHDDGDDDRYNYKFKGNTAEWILEGHKNRAVPNFGAAFVYNCLATTANGEERDLNCSRLVDMVRDDKKLSTPVKVTENVLAMYWGDGISAHRVDAGTGREQWFKNHVPATVEFSESSHFVLRAPKIHKEAIGSVQEYIGLLKVSGTLYINCKDDLEGSCRLELGRNEKYFSARFYRTPDEPFARFSRTGDVLFALFLSEIREGKLLNASGEAVWEDIDKDGVGRGQNVSA